MIHFFRKIRYQLSQNNQFFKYLKYAAGEIILVVMGILLALYINEWNSLRNDIRYEKKVLSDIQKDIQREIASLKDFNHYTIQRVEKISLLDSLLNEKAPIRNKFLDTLFGSIWGLHTYRVGDKVKFESLKSHGLDIIQVDSIKEQLIFVYEVIYPSLENINALELKQNEMVYLPYYMKNFTDVKIRISATPIDFESVWEDPEYHNIVSYRLNLLVMNHIQNDEYFLDQMELLDKMISNYLDQGN